MGETKKRITKAERIVRKLKKVRTEKNIILDLPWHPSRTWKRRKPSDIKKIVVHTTGSSNQNPFNTNNYHITPGKDNHISKKACPHLCYHHFIDSTGLDYKCNDYTDITWHSGLMNSKSIGIVMAFKGQIDTNKPTTEQYLSMIDLCANLCIQFNIQPNNVIGHREVSGMYTILGNGSRKYKKTCPGMSISLQSLRKNVSIVLQSIMITKGLYDGEIDGIWGKLSKKGFAELVKLKE